MSCVCFVPCIYEEDKVKLVFLWCVQSVSTSPSTNIRWPWTSDEGDQELKVPIPVFLVWFCVCLCRPCKQLHFLCTNSHINYFTSGWHPGPWVQKFIVGSLTLFHYKKAVQAQVYLTLIVMLMVSQKAYEELIHFQEPFMGLKKIQMPFPHQSACDETLCGSYKKQAHWINRLQTLTKFIRTSA